MKILPILNIQNGIAVSVAEGGAPAGDILSLVGFLLDQGCHRLALVDVDAARGHGHNREVLARAMHGFHAGNPKVCIQVGGGIRSSDQAQFFLDHGATWLSVGTILSRSPLMVEQLLARFREHLTATLDVRGGELLASGWSGPSGRQVRDVAARIGEFGFRRLLFMDIPGTPDAEPDFVLARDLAQASRVPLYMGGSLRNPGHLAQAREVQGLLGVAIEVQRIRQDPALTAFLDRASN